MNWKKRKTPVPLAPEPEETFTLEDILREFGSNPAPAESTAPAKSPPDMAAQAPPSKQADSQLAPGPATEPSLAETSPVSRSEAAAVETSPAPAKLKSPRQKPLPPRPATPPAIEPDEIDLLLASAPKPKPRKRQEAKMTVPSVHAEKSAPSDKAEKTAGASTRTEKTAASFNKIEETVASAANAGKAATAYKPEKALARTRQSTQARQPTQNASTSPLDAEAKSPAAKPHKKDAPATFREKATSAVEVPRQKSAPTGNPAKASPDADQEAARQTVKTAPPAPPGAAAFAGATAPDAAAPLPKKAATSPLSATAQNVAEPQAAPQTRTPPQKAAAKPPKIKKAKAPVSVRVRSAQALRRECAQRLGSSRLRLVICLLLSLAEIALVIYQECNLSWIPALEKGNLAATISILLWVLCVLLAYNILVRGFEQLFRLRIGLETLCGVSTVLIGIDAIASVSQGRMPYCAIGALELTFALWGLSDGYLGRLHTLSALQNAEDPRSVQEITDVWNGKSGLFRGKGDVQQFLQQMDQPDLTTRAMQIYAPLALAASFGFALYLSSTGKQPFTQAWMILLMGAIPLCGFISYTHPFRLLAKRLAKSGSAVCGWFGVRIFSGPHILLLRDEDIFPVANISLNGVKLYSGHPMGRVISYAAAVTDACGSTLAPIFEELRNEQRCRHYPVSMYRYYEGGGVGAEVLDDVVLMGSLRFMNSMGVHMAAGMKVRQAVYMSINGELACVFAMKYKPSASAAGGLQAIVANGHFETVLATRDFLLTPEYLQERYRVPAEKLTYPPVKERLRLSRQNMEAQGEQGALLRKDDFAAFAHTICGGRVLRTCVQFGTAVDLLAGIAGLMLMALLLWLDAMATASVFNLLLFTLIWALPGLLLSRWTKRV